MTLRIATIEDKEQLITWVKETIKDSAYSKFFTSDEFVEESVPLFLNPETQNQRIALIISSDDKDIGCTLWDTVPVEYTNEKMARFVIIYIEPEYRKKGLMNEVHEAFEYWAKLTGCRYTHIGISSESNLEGRGYSKYEVLYIKEIN